MARFVTLIRYDGTTIFVNPELVALIEPRRPARDEQPSEVWLRFSVPTAGVGEDMHPFREAVQGTLAEVIAKLTEAPQ